MRQGIWGNSRARSRKIPRIKRLIVRKRVGFIAIIALWPEVIDQTRLKLGRISVNGPTKEKIRFAVIVSVLEDERAAFVLCRLPVHVVD
jgi:hypothetical protein